EPSHWKTAELSKKSFFAGIEIRRKRPPRMIPAPTKPQWFEDRLSELAHGGPRWCAPKLAHGGPRRCALALAHGGPAPLRAGRLPMGGARRCAPELAHGGRPRRAAASGSLPAA